MQLTDEQLRAFSAYSLQRAKEEADIVDQMKRIDCPKEIVRIALVLANSYYFVGLDLDGKTSTDDLSGEIARTLGEAPR